MWGHQIPTVWPISTHRQHQCNIWSAYAPKHTGCRDVSQGKGPSVQEKQLRRLRCPETPSLSNHLQFPLGLSVCHLTRVRRTQDSNLVSGPTCGVSLWVRKGKRMCYSKTRKHALLCHWASNPWAPACGVQMWKMEVCSWLWLHQHRTTLCSVHEKVSI